MQLPEEWSTTKSLITGRVRARHGSSTVRSPSWKSHRWSWHTFTPRSGP